MKKKRKVPLDEFHYHEVIDRLYLIANFLDEALMDHPAVLENKELKKRIKKAVKELAEAYQIAGGVRYTKFKEEGEK
jgi:hypothetical protein